MSSSSRWLAPSRAALAAACASLALSAAAVPAVASAPPTVPEHVQRNVDNARLVGKGALHWYGLKVYEARLYAPRGFDPRDPLAAPFVLELTYARKLKGKAIAERSRDEIARLGFGDPGLRADWLRRMEAIFPDVDANHSLAGVHQPGAGARFYADGRFVGSIDDAQFARAFFSIWLDERTSAPQLRKRLLPTQGTSGG